MNYDFVFLVFSMTLIVMVIILAISVVAIISQKAEIKTQAIEALSSLSQNALKKIKGR